MAITKVTRNLLNTGIDDQSNATAITIDSSENVTFTGTGQATRLGLGVAPHATAALNITTTNQHMRLNNGAELGIIELDSDGHINIWAHGDNETINLKTGSGSGANVLSVVGNNVGIGTSNPLTTFQVKVATNKNLMVQDALSSTALKFLNDGGTAYTTGTINADSLIINADSGGNITAPNQPSFLCYPTANFTASAGSGVYTFSSESFDKGGNYNTTNGRFTAPVSGRYLFTAVLAMFSSTTALTYFGIGFRVNGSGDIYYGGWGHKPSDSTFARNSSTVILELLANDYVEIYIETAASHGVYGAGNGSNTRWSGQLLS